MQQNLHAVPYKNDLVINSNPAIIRSNLTNPHLNNCIPLIGTQQQTTRSFYANNSSFGSHSEQRYAALYGMQRPRQRNYHSYNGCSDNRPYYCEEMNDTSNIYNKHKNTYSPKKSKYPLNRCSEAKNQQNGQGSVSKSEHCYKRVPTKPLKKYNHNMNNIIVAECVNGSDTNPEQNNIANKESSAAEDTNGYEETTNTAFVDLDGQKENMEPKNMEMATTTLNVDEATHNKSGESVVVDSTRESVEGDSTRESVEVASTSTNSREKTPMCLLNDLARYNKIPFQYRLTSENGPPHCKRFTVTLKLGEEEYTADGNKIKNAQHLAAKEALQHTKYKHPIPKAIRRNAELGGARIHITPTVELNALAMKMGQQAYYLLDNTRQMASPLVNLHPMAQTFRGDAQNSVYVQKFTPCLPTATPGTCVPAMNRINPLAVRTMDSYKVTLIFGKQKFSGFGQTPQQAKHDAAAQALQTIKNQANEQQIEEENQSRDDAKSPISLVFEIGLKRNLSVNFKVVREDGPAHMRKFTTACMVGSITTEAEGTGKKISKKRAAQKMLDELLKLPPITSRVTPIKRTKMKGPINCENSATNNDPKVKEHPKKRTEGSSKWRTIAENSNWDPITKLVEWCQIHNEKEPIYEIISEQKPENTRRRQFVMEVTCQGTVARGTGNNKKLAKRNAAKSLLIAMGIEPPDTENQFSSPSEKSATMQEKDAPTTMLHTTEAIPPTVPTTEASNLLTYKNRILDQNKCDGGGSEETDQVQIIEPSTNKEQNVQQIQLSGRQINATKENACTEGKESKSVGLHMKDQLLYLANLLGFEVNFSDYPKGNHNESLTIVMLSTNPPQICHGIGTSSEESQENASKNALKILSEMGLHNIKSS